MHLQSICSILLLILFAAGQLHAFEVVVPQSREFVEGNGNNAIPFSGISQRKYQQVYASSEFDGKTGYIDEIRFRVNAGHLAIPSGTELDIEIKLSHTTAIPSSISSTFADNVGPDEVTVLDGVVMVSALAGAELTSTIPNPFEVVFDVADTFKYNGSDNLLMEVRQYSSQIFFSPFDAVGPGDPGHTLTDRVWSSDLDATTGDTGGPFGLVTKFVLIPEPTTCTLALAALCLVMGRRRG